MTASIKLPDESGGENETGATIKNIVDSNNNGLKNNADIANQEIAEIRNARANSRGSGRLVALDAARGLAVKGMYLAGIRFDI